MLLKVSDLDEDELVDLAREIFDAAFDSIGFECLEHS